MKRIIASLLAAVALCSAAWANTGGPAWDKFPKDREYYFGTLGSTWVTLAHGRDVVLEPPQQGPPINMLHGPVAEVDGKPFEGIRWVAHYKNAQEAAAKYPHSSPNFKH